MVSYYLGPTEHEYTKKKFFSPRLKFRKNSVYHASQHVWTQNLMTDEKKIPVPIINLRVLIITPAK